MPVLHQNTLTESELQNLALHMQIDSKLKDVIHRALPSDVNVTLNPQNGLALLARKKNKVKFPLNYQVSSQRFGYFNSLTGQFMQVRPETVKRILYH